ncbi:Mbov_0396 family ICE element transmembrane protein [Enterocloster citroniae]|uniref:Membrane protein YgcG n=2 Tax=Enterocloster citroniae TaxID=358743 RepID=A0ABV2G643_9FIRM|nr:hypothetical protein [Enterocloster citroniae]KMW09493.1 hypothetical protein HMPREF9470_05641 [[Clostridium] citroniae WAL-19142]
MEMAYLGLFQKIFNWVLNHIFDPVFKWLSKLLSTALSWLFNELLADILLPVLKDTVDYFIEIFMDIFCGVIYGLFSGILKLIDYLEIAFDVFIGVRDVSFGSKGNKITGSLLEVLFQQETINKTFWILTSAGLAIALLLTIYMTAKSAFDLDFDNRKPVSKVLASMMKTFVQFFAVPFFVWFVIELASIILGSITSLLGGQSETTLGRIIFVISSLNAALDSNYNANSNISGIILGTTSDDMYRYPFYSMNAMDAKDYGDISVVTNSFDLSEFDYLVGFIAAIFLFFVLAACLLSFVQRIFEIILLYIVSPYFVSTIPLDDGERFGKWRELFVGKTFSGFGSAIGMRLYLMVCPLIMSGSINFGAGSSPEMDYLVKLFFLVGGAWAVYKSGPMLTQILSYQAAQTETMTQRAASYGIHQTTRQIYRGGKQLLSSALSAKDSLDDKKKQGTPDEKSEKYTGKENGAGKQSGSAGSGGSSGKSSGGSSGGGEGQSKWAKSSGSQKAKSGKSGSSETQRSGVKIGSHREDRGRLANNSHREDRGRLSIGSHREARGRLELGSHRMNSQAGRNGQQDGSNRQNSNVQKITVIRETQIRTRVVHVRDSGGNAVPRYSSYSKLEKKATKPETGRK